MTCGSDYSSLEDIIESDGDIGLSDADITHDDLLEKIDVCSWVNFVNSQHVVGILLNVLWARFSLSIIAEKRPSSVVLTFDFSTLCVFPLRLLAGGRHNN